MAIDRLSALAVAAACVVCAPANAQTTTLADAQAKVAGRYANSENGLAFVVEGDKVRVTAEATGEPQATIFDAGFVAVDSMVATSHQYFPANPGDGQPEMLVVWGEGQCHSYAGTEGARKKITQDYSCSWIFKLNNNRQLGRILFSASQLSGFKN